MPKKRGQERGSTLQVSLYAQKAWAGKRKHLTGIPLCPENMGRKEETPYRYPFMPKKRGQERGKERETWQDQHWGQYGR